MGSAPSARAAVDGRGAGLAVTRALGEPGVVFLPVEPGGESDVLRATARPAPEAEANDWVGIMLNAPCLRWCSPSRGARAGGEPASRAQQRHGERAENGHGGEVLEDAHQPRICRRSTRSGRGS